MSGARTLRAIVLLTATALRRIVREGLVIRSVVSPALIAAGTLTITIAVLAWYRPSREVGVAPTTPPELVAALQADGFAVRPVPDALRAVEDRVVPAAVDGRDVVVLGIATHGLEVERTVRRHYHAAWIPDPPTRLPDGAEAAEAGRRVCPALAVFFVLYGVVFGLGSIARDHDDGALAAELTLPVPRWVPALARWLSASLVLTLFYALCVALVAAMIGVRDPASVLVNGAAACTGSTALGLAVVGGRGLRAAFSGPFVLGISAATGLLGLGATPAASWLPMASIFGDGPGWVPLALGILSGGVASVVFAWRTRRG